MWALWRFSPDMPCVRGGLADCDSHPTDHNRFLRYTSLMDIRIWEVSEDHHAEVPKYPRGVASSADEANDAHAVLAAGYRDWSDTRGAGWPSRIGGFRALPPWPRNMPWAQGQPSDGISLRDILDEAIFVLDAS